MRSTIVPLLAKPCLRPAGTMTSWLGFERDARVADPHLGLAFEHAQNFLDRVQMRGRAVAPLAPLLEHAKLGRAVPRRDDHLRHDARPPFFLRLAIEIDELHGAPRLGCLSQWFGSILSRISPSAGDARQF